METEEEVVEETQTQEETQETSESDNSESVQQTEGTQEETQAPKKEPKIWQVVRDIQKSVKDLKTQQPQTVVKEQKDMSSKDLYALMEHKVPSKHIDEVVKASKILGKSIPETLADGFVQARLKTLAEEEQTANATNTGGSKRTTAKLTDEQIVQRYMEGKEVDPDAFALARINLRKKK